MRSTTYLPRCARVQHSANTFRHHYWLCGTWQGLLSDSGAWGEICCAWQRGTGQSLMCVTVGHRARLTHLPNVASSIPEILKEFKTGRQTYVQIPEQYRADTVHRSRHHSITFVAWQSTFVKVIVKTKSGVFSWPTVYIDDQMSCA